MTTINRHSHPHMRSYVFNGLNLTISSDSPRVLTALQARLRHFSSQGQGPSDLCFTFLSVPTKMHHWVVPPQERTRLIYDWPTGEVVYANSTDQLYLTDEERVRVLCAPSRGKVQVSVCASARDHLWLLSHPLFTIPLVECLKRRGYYSLHAAGLWHNGKGLLLPGQSGAGKSTLALALVRAGWGFLGDDLLFLQRGQADLQAFAFPDEVDVTEDTVRMFPELHTLLQQPTAPGWPKRQVQVEEFYATAISRVCRPAVLVFPRITHTARSVLIPLTSDVALLELVPNVLLTTPRASQAHLDVLAELVNTSMCYRLEMGRDIDALPKLLEALME